MILPDPFIPFLCAALFNALTISVVVRNRPAPDVYPAAVVFLVLSGGMTIGEGRPWSGASLIVWSVLLGVVLFLQDRRARRTEPADG